MSLWLFTTSQPHNIYVIKLLLIFFYVFFIDFMTIHISWRQAPKRRPNSSTPQRYRPTLSRTVRVPAPSFLPVGGWATLFFFFLSYAMHIFSSFFSLELSSYALAAISLLDVHIDYNSLGSVG
jgi:hypothetical protein